MNSNSEKSESVHSSEFQENLNILRQISVFSPLPIEVLKVFAYLCNRETYKSDEFLFQKNEDDGNAFFVISGSAALIYEDPEKAIEESINTFGPGEFIGGLTLLGKMPRLFSLKATSETRCLVMDRDRFSKAIEQFPELMPKILNALVDRIYRWEKKFLSGHAVSCNDCLRRAGVSLV